MAAQNYSFDQRKDDQPIEFTGGVNEVCEGCTVALSQNGQPITVRVEGNEGHAWTGEITGFANNEKKLGELKVGTTIKFDEQNVFRCAA